jgi:hypothetical protein
VVPTFTTNRSTREMPSYIPAASPRVRRSLSSWPPHRSEHPGSGVARPVLTADAHDTPTQIHQVRVGSTLTGLHALVPLVHLLVSLAGPAPSGSADAPRRCQDCSPPSPASPGSGCPQLQPGCCDSPAARAFHPYSVTLAPRGARTHHRNGDQHRPPPNGAAWLASEVPAPMPRWSRWATRHRYSPVCLLPRPAVLRSCWAPSRSGRLSRPRSTTGPPPRPGPINGPCIHPNRCAAGGGGRPGEPERFPRSSANPSTGSAPSYAPAPSPRLRRRLSPWPPQPATSPSREVPRQPPGDHRVRGAIRPMSARFRVGGCVLRSV